MLESVLESPLRVEFKGKLGDGYQNSIMFGKQEFEVIGELTINGNVNTVTLQGKIQTRSDGPDFSITVAALAGAASGVFFAYSPDLPEISELDRYTPGTITRLYARGGELIGEFATERRLILGYDEIPAVLRNAIIAAEDGDFFNHVGIDIPRIVITMVFGEPPAYDH